MDLAMRFQLAVYALLFGVFCRANPVTANAINPNFVTRPAASMVVDSVLGPLSWDKLELAIYNGYDYNTRQAIAAGQLLAEPDDWYENSSYKGNYYARLYYNGKAVEGTEAQRGLPNAVVGQTMCYCKFPIKHILYHVWVKAQVDNQPELWVTHLEVELTDDRKMLFTAKELDNEDFCVVFKAKYKKLEGKSKKDTVPAVFGADDLPPGLQGPLLISAVGGLALLALMLRRWRLAQANS